nr:bifunctional diguanylate cyclase/phosphodiesterase [Motilibacter aurantiacus]
MFAVADWRPERNLLLLGLGLLAQTLGDTVWLAQSAAGTYTPHNLLPDLLYGSAVCLCLLAAWARPRDRVTRPLAWWAVLAVPTALGTVAVVTLVLAGLSRQPASCVALAAAAVVGVLARAVLAVRDVHSLAQSRKEARTDELTGLANRRAFHEAAERHFGDHPDVPAAVLLFDVDRFKEVNDSLGHSVGDELLVELAARWSACIPGSGLLTRLGGDEFAVLIPAAGEQEGLALASRLRRSLDGPVALAGIAVHVSASVGVAAGGAGEGVAELLRRADIAMYAAKAGPGARAYSTVDDERLDRLRLGESLRAVLGGEAGHGRLVLHYQPQLCLRSGAVLGLEALVRWSHPGRGLVGPAEILPLAELIGRGRDLARAVLGQAVEQAARWHGAGARPKLSVNLAPADLLMPDLPDLVASLLWRHGLEPEFLVLEITEDSFMKERAQTLRALEALRRIGVTISIDDYGTGYSSLSYLRDLTASELKMDRSFVGDMTTCPRSAAIVRSTIALAHDLGLVVVAEGVETPETEEELRLAGCDVAQGYLYARPLPAEQVSLEARALPAPLR